jgi:hypothetical protein
MAKPSAVRLVRFLTWIVNLPTQPKLETRRQCFRLKGATELQAFPRPARWCGQQPNCLRQKQLRVVEQPYFDVDV